MDPAQFSRLMDFLNGMKPTLVELAKPNYTLTGSADWPIALILITALFCVLGFMWKDLRSTNHEALDRIVSDYKERISTLEEEVEWCQDNCCNITPKRRKGDKKHTMKDTSGTTI